MHFILFCRSAVANTIENSFNADGLTDWIERDEFVGK